MTVKDSFSTQKRPKRLARRREKVYCSCVRTITKKNKTISAAREDYLRAIYLLQLGSGEASVTDIAERLKLSKSTVSERLKDLAKDGLVKIDPYTPVSLTEKGALVGKKLTSKHRIIEVFLNKVLKMPKDKVHAEAERLEHACSDEVAKRLEKFLEYPDSDPHGSSIPKIDKWI